MNGIRRVQAVKITGLPRDFDYPRNPSAFADGAEVIYVDADKVHCLDESKSKGNFHLELRAFYISPGLTTIDINEEARKN